MSLTKKIKIVPEALPIIGSMKWTALSDNARSTKKYVGILTCGQLDRKMYEAVNKGLAALGGKWNKKEGCHLFDSDPRAQLEELLETGSVNVERDGFFRTQRPVVLEMIDMFDDLREPILEPEAGEGDICDVLREKGFHEITCIEKNPARREILRKKLYNLSICTELEDYVGGAKFPSIIMNPPFEKGQDIEHIMYAFRNCLSSGGELVSVASEGPFFRQDANSKAFRNLVEECGYSKQLPPGSFKESGTLVNTRLVHLFKEIPAHEHRPSRVDTSSE